jgi:hypothetical protein
LKIVNGFTTLKATETRDYDRLTVAWSDTGFGQGLPETVFIFVKISPLLNYQMFLKTAREN